MPLDAFYRVDGFQLKDWEEMRRSGTSCWGRFLRGRVRYVRARDAPAYGGTATAPPAPDLRVLDVIRSCDEGMSLRQIVPVGASKEEVKGERGPPGP